MQLTPKQRDALAVFMRMAGGRQVHPVSRVMFANAYGFDPGCGDPLCEECGEINRDLLGISGEPEVTALLDRVAQTNGK